MQTYTHTRLMQTEVECLQDDSCVMDMASLIDLRIKQVRVFAFECVCE